MNKLFKQIKINLIFSLAYLFLSGTHFLICSKVNHIHHMSVKLMYLWHKTYHNQLRISETKVRCSLPSKSKYHFQGVLEQVNIYQYISRPIQFFILQIWPAFSKTYTIFSASWSNKLILRIFVDELSFSALLHWEGR